MMNINNNFKNILLYFAICILYFTLISCSHFKITDLLQEKTENREYLYTADLTYQRNNFYPLDLNPPLKEIWQKKYESIANQGFTCIQDLLLFSNNKGKIQLIQPADGEEIASFKIKGIAATPPTIYQNIIYQSCETGKYGLVVYDLIRDKFLWRINKNFSRSAPVIYEEKVFHQTLKGDVICYNDYSGEEIWRNSLSSPLYNSAAYKAHILYAACQNGEIVALESSSGIIIWQQNLDQSVLANPVIHNNILAISTYQGNIYLLDLKTGNINGKIGMEAPLYYGPAIDDQYIYIVLSNGQARAYDKVTLKQTWEYHGDGPVSGEPLITNSYLYYATLANKLYILDKKDGKPVQVIDLKSRARSTPVIYQGKLIIACEKRNIIAFETLRAIPEDKQSE